MLLVTLILYVLGCALMVAAIRVRERPNWSVGWAILLILIWGWPFVTATIVVHDLIAPLFEKKKAN
jgi:hypothetical protein